MIFENHWPTALFKAKSVTWNPVTYSGVFLFLSISLKSLFHIVQQNIQNFKLNSYMSQILVKGVCKNCDPQKQHMVGLQ